MVAIGVELLPPRTPKMPPELPADWSSDSTPAPELNAPMEDMADS